MLFRSPIELTLTNRDDMGFRMLLGRSAIKRRFLVDPGRSFLGGGTRATPPAGRPSFTGSVPPDPA